MTILREIALKGDLDFSLVCCTQVILNELEQGLTLSDIAVTYACAIKSAANGADAPDWQVINTAIVARFGHKGLDYIKKIALKKLEGKKS